MEKLRGIPRFHPDVEELLFAHLPLVLYLHTDFMIVFFRSVLSLLIARKATFSVILRTEVTFLFSLMVQGQMKGGLTMQTACQSVEIAPAYRAIATQRDGLIAVLLQALFPKGYRNSQYRRLLPVH